MTVEIILWLCLWFLSPEELKALSLPISSLFPTSQGSGSYYPLSWVSGCSDLPFGSGAHLLLPRPWQGPRASPSLALGLEHPISWKTKKAWLTAKGPLDRRAGQGEGELRHQRKQREWGREGLQRKWEVLRRLDSRLASDMRAGTVSCFSFYLLDQA